MPMFFVRSQRLCVSYCAVLLVLGCLAPAASAQVTRNVANVTQLQAAIAASNAGPGGDRIILATGVYAISAQLRIDQDVTVEGDPLALTVIDAGGLSDIFSVRADNFTLVNLTLQNARIAVGFEGSGVFSGTGLTITGTTDMAFYPGDSGGATFFTNSTISNNSGNGIEISCAEMHLTNTTIANNAIGVRFGFPCGNRMQIVNSLIVANGQDCGGGGSFDPIGLASFDSDGSCVAFGFGPGLTTVGLAALGLGNLLPNGGPTETRAIAAGSPAVNTGDATACPATDQRGFLRNDGACDIGAYEDGASAGGGNTPAGAGVSVAPAPGVSVTFAAVTSPGDTTSTAGGPPPPTGFQIDGLVYDLSTTATFTGPITVCLPYSPTTNPVPLIYHFEDVPPPAWVDRTTSFDPVNRIVCGIVSSLSPFAVLAPIDVTQQLQDLQVLINNFNLRKPVDKRFTHRVDKLKTVWVSDRRNRSKQFCHELAKFTQLIAKESGKTLTASEANQLLALTVSIRGSAGC